MNAFRRLPHKRGDSNYRIVIIPKKKNKVIDDCVRKKLDATLSELAQQEGITILEGHLIRGYAHLYMNDPPRTLVASGVGYLREQEGVTMAGVLNGRQGSGNGLEFEDQEKGVSAIDLDNAVSEYIRDQDYEDEYFVQSSWI